MWVILRGGPWDRGVCGCWDRGVVRFIRGGGLEVSREREKREIQDEREQLRAEQFAASQRPGPFERFVSEDERINGLSAARGLLKFLIN